MIVGQYKLKDQTLVLIRPLEEADGPHLSKGIENLSKKTSHQRFLSPKRKVTPQQLRYLTTPDGYEHVALCMILVPLDNEEPMGIGVGRCIREEKGGANAEVAVTIVDEWQGKGAGKLLLSILADWGMKNGISQWTGLMLETNKTAAALMSQFGELVKRRPTEPGIIELTLKLDPSLAHLATVNDDNIAFKQDN